TGWANTTRRQGFVSIRSRRAMRRRIRAEPRPRATTPTHHVRRHGIWADRSRGPRARPRVSWHAAGWQRLRSGTSPRVRLASLARRQRPSFVARRGPLPLVARRERLPCVDRWNPARRQRPRIHHARPARAARWGVLLRPGSLARRSAPPLGPWIGRCPPRPLPARLVRWLRASGATSTRWRHSARRLPARPAVLLVVREASSHLGIPPCGSTWRARYDARASSHPCKISTAATWSMTARCWRPFTPRCDSMRDAVTVL